MMDSNLGLPPAEVVAGLSLEDADRIMGDLVMEEQRRVGYKMRAYFPETGPCRRSLYPKHMAFIAAGRTYRERCFLAANQVGKTDLGAYETAAHLTGLYPDWWHGRVFTNAIRAWAAGDTAKTVKDILQVKLLGPPGQYGMGMLPSHTLKHISHKPGNTGAVDQVWVRHVAGGISTLTLKCHPRACQILTESGAFVPVC